MLQAIDSKMVMIYATICGYSIFMTNNAFKTQLFQIIIEKREFNEKMEKKWIIYIPP